MSPGTFAMFQGPPSTLNWGYMAVDIGYLGPNKLQVESLGCWCFLTVVNFEVFLLSLRWHLCL